MFLPARQRRMLGSLGGILLAWFDSGCYSGKGCAFIESAMLYCISAGGIRRAAMLAAMICYNRQTERQIPSSLLSARPANPSLSGLEQEVMSQRPLCVSVVHLLPSEQLNVQFSPFWRDETLCRLVVSQIYCFLFFSMSFNLSMQK